MPTAAPNTSGDRHSTATALNAPIEAPVVITSMAWPPRSAWMAGTTSHLTNSWNWLSSHIRCSAGPSFVTIAWPATLSTEYSLIRPSASSGPHALTRPCRSISSASPPADGNTSTGTPSTPQRATVTSVCRRSENHRSLTLRSSLMAVHHSWHHARTLLTYKSLLINEFLWTRENPRQPVP